MRSRQPKHSRQDAYTLGLRAEQLASFLLFFKGYKVIAKRWPSPVGEIDLIARRGHTLVFIEVKARPSLNAALESIRPHQRARILRGAQDFLAKHPRYSDYNLRFDAVVVAPGLLPRHLPNAFDATR